MSVREKYNASLQEFRRAESLPERLSLWRRLWAWFIFKCRNSTTVFAIFLLPFYLIAIGIWKINECGGENDTPNISIALIVAGGILLICALYLPIRRYAKAQALKERQQRLEVASPRAGAPEPDLPENLTDEEIARHTPCRMNRICNYAFCGFCGILPVIALWIFRMPSDAQCAPIIYWTAFVLSVIYCIYLVIVLASCSICCCAFVIWPFCMEKCKGRMGEGGAEAV